MIDIMPDYIAFQPCAVLQQNYYDESEMVLAQQLQCYGDNKRRYNLLKW